MIPRIAIIDSNTLAAVGLKDILQGVIPMMRVDTFNSFADLTEAVPDQYYHYFVSLNIVLDNRDFFTERKRKTIVLTTMVDPNSQLGEFHCLNVNQSEQELVKSLLKLEQTAHSHGRNLPPVPKTMQKKMLSDREIEVLSLIAQGYLNKEIADKLSIGLATVITHRRNIMDKLNMKSVSALTIYAVTRGYVDINSI